MKKNKQYWKEGLLRSQLLIVAILIMSLTSCVQEKSKILIIGDSISIGYTPFVKENLKEVAEVFHNPGNAQHSDTGLKKIEEWISDEKWDIIQINWGLWDLCYRLPDSTSIGSRDKENGIVTNTIDKYASNLDSIVNILQTKTDAILIFVTTTYVPKNEPGRFKNDEISYNEAAKKIMKKHSVIVNDIWEESVSIHQKLGKGLDDVHYSSQGYEKLSELMTLSLNKEIKLTKSILKRKS